MTEKETTINDAIEGGWKNSFLVTRPQDAYKAKLKIIMLRFEECEGGGWTSKHKENIPLSEALLDPKFWQAVGVTRVNLRRWRRPIANKSEGLAPIPAWKYHWHQFIDHLADGLTIEEALTKLR